MIPRLRSINTDPNSIRIKDKDLDSFKIKVPLNFFFTTFFFLPLLFLLLIGCFEVDPLEVDTVHCPTPFASGYNRDYFGGWIDEDGDGEDTRWEVLEEENIGDRDFVYSNNIKSFLNPKWIGPYSGNTFMDPSELDIDHLVPVKEAWISGACFWDEDRRVRFYNFLADTNHLLAVDSSYNRQKGDKDPVNWRPTNSFEQNYLLYWSQIKVNWGLTADALEYDFLQKRLGSDLPPGLQVTRCGCE